MFELVKDEKLDKKISSKKEQSKAQSTDNNQISFDTLNWSSIGGSSSNFTTCTLNHVSPNRVESVESSGNKLFTSLFLIIGICSLIVLLFNSGATNSWIALVVGVAFISVKFFFKHEPAIVDKDIGWYWKGSNKLTKRNEILRIEEKINISAILAVQVLEDYVTDSDGDYYCYELNFYCEKGIRKNFMRHGGCNDMRRDGKMMADFLEVPYFENMN